MFITFEGIEGSGKTTQIELLAKYLTDKGLSVVKTREPGGTPLGEALRDVVLRHNLEVFPLPELFVMTAMRAQHVEQVIMPALAEGKVVLCDRFTDATCAYQGYGRGIDCDIIETLNRLVTKGIRPNLTILINCTVSEGLRRMKAGGRFKDRFEKESARFHGKIQRAYVKLAKNDPKRFFVIDGKGGIDEIQGVIREHVEKLIENRGF